MGGGEQIEALNGTTEHVLEFSASVGRIRVVPTFPAPAKTGWPVSLVNYAQKCGPTTDEIEK